MEKISVSAFLLLVALSYTLAKDITVKSGAKKDTKDSAPKLPQTLSRGWGDQLIWTQTYEEALYKSKTSNKPLMIIHHLDECPHSQALKKVFAENKEIQKLAEQFVLLNLVVSSLFSLLTFLHDSLFEIDNPSFPMHSSHTARTGVCSKCLLSQIKEKERERERERERE
uniref:Anterior gradient 2, protein disulphide isomerase family member n=1 Tax=Felis catus TaxID=9685 RepID=A0ABI7W0Z0_FELCA